MLTYTEAFDEARTAFAAAYEAYQGEVALFRSGGVDAGLARFARAQEAYKAAQTAYDVAEDAFVSADAANAAAYADNVAVMASEPDNGDRFW